MLYKILSSTFITLVTKKDLSTRVTDIRRSSLTSRLNDFRPSSLTPSAYKILAKILSVILRD